MYMTITSFHFLVFVTIAVTVYYLVPKAWQWIALLTMSLLFYHYAARTRTIIFLLISTFTVYICTMWMARIKRNKNGSSKMVNILAAIAVTVNLVLWFILKGYEYWSVGIKAIGHFHGTSMSGLLNMELIAALGMGYYTFQLIGYVLDCAWGIAEPQRNPFKLFLFTCFFPQMVTGPISRYSQLEPLYDRHNISFQNITHGSQRILWGFFKKLVLAERVGIIVSGITHDLNTYNGFYAWIAILLYPIQMYADFSGCMDIVIGVAELFDIKLAENFRTPFFARTVQEFWQRFHITLGVWAKDYVLYPLMRSRPMQKFGKFTREKFGKSLGKKIATSVSLLAPWFVIGVWHGGYRYIVGVNLWNWVILTLSELLSPVFNKITKMFHFRTESFSWHFFQSSRTYIIYAMGITFFAEGIREGLQLLKTAAQVITGGTVNPWIFFDGSILNLGIEWRDINLIIIAVILLIVVGVLSEKYGYARNWMDKQSVFFRWSVWVFLFLMVLVYGKYGPEYHAGDFIYQRF